MTAQTILPANSVTGGFEVANSVRLEAGDNPSAAVTQGTPTNIDKYTFSVWVKRADIGAANSKIFSVTSGGTYGEEKLEFNQDDLIWRQTEASEGNTNWERVTDRKFRDPSAWYHIVVAYDSTDGTAANRAKMYINGVQETSFSGSTNPGSGADSYTNTSGRSLKFFALHGNLNDQNNGGYFSEMVYVDGQQLAPTDFGEFDSDSGIWKPIDVSGLTFGDNGFYLEFKETGTSANASGIGADTSGNGNHVAVTNITATDISTDTCTNNFATLNPLKILGTATTSFEEGNLQFNSTNNNWSNTFSTIAFSQGKWYAEFKVITLASSTGYGSAGIADVNDADDNSSASTINVNSESAGVVFDYRSGQSAIKSATSSVTSNIGNFSANDIVGMAVDMDNRALYVHLNGTYYQISSVTGVPTSGASKTGAITIPTSVIDCAFTVGGYSTSFKGTWNFGSPPYAISSGNADGDGHGNFEFAVPSGYFALCTKNLAEYG